MLRLRMLTEIFELERVEKGAKPGYSACDLLLPFVFEFTQPYDS